MSEIDKRAADLLIIALEKEIDLKCSEIREKKRIARLKKIFFTGCLFILVLFPLQFVFNIFDLNLLLIFLIYQGVALAFITPLILNSTKGGITR
jgi:hypothetical protein